jgi:hypothetical protein
MREAIPALPNTPSWRGAQLKKAQGQLIYFIAEHMSERGQNLNIKIPKKKILPKCGRSQYYGKTAEGNKSEWLSGS